MEWETIAGGNDPWWLRRKLADGRILDVSTLNEVRWMGHVYRPGLAGKTAGLEFSCNDLESRAAAEAAVEHYAAGAPLESSGEQPCPPGAC